MRLRQLGLQLQRLLRERAGFFAALAGALESMDDPTFQLGIARNSERKFRIELDGPRIKAFTLLEFPEILNGVLEIMRLDKSEIGLAVLRWAAFHSRFFYRRKLRLERFRDFLGEIGLNRKDVGQIAVVIARPKMFVRGRIDQLHVNANTIPGTAHAAFQNV